MPQAQRPAFTLGPDEGRLIDRGTFTMVVKATAADTGAAFSLLEATEPAGFSPPMHIHHDAAEAFYVLAGEHIVFLEKREFACQRATRWHPSGAVRRRFGQPPSVE